ncbi:MAG TPA: NADH-quinone oxidoreductase subunit M [bacterium]|nr:NADH-quinone oxidoreductase subunit M [bacterium]
MRGWPLLSILVFLPVAGAAVAAIVDRRREQAIRWTGLAASLLTLGVVLVIFERFAVGTPAVQFEERAVWIPAAGIAYHLGIDGISLPLVLLTTVIMPLALLSSWSSVGDRVKEFTVSMLVLETALLGTFLSLDLVLFYVFWDAVLIPMYFIIGLWGGPRRVYAAFKFILYTASGSALMLVAIIVLYLQSGPAGARTFDWLALREAPVAMPLQAWLFAAFALAFAIKVPLWPLHTWLPDAHTEAPTPGSVVLAAVLLKMGTYGFLRFLLPLFPEASRRFAPLLVTLAIIGILYGAAVSWAQRDMKRLVAMSSVSHLGFVTLGAFALTVEGLQGSLLQMVNHGISTGGLFLVVGVLYDRTHSRLLDDYGGVAALMPRFAAVATIVMLSSMALPGTNGFVGEFLILLGAFRAAPVYAVVAAGGVILSAVYLLWMYQRVMHGPVAVKERARVVELSRRELVLFVPLIALIFWIGLFPGALLSRSEASIRALVERVEAAR